MKKMTSLICSVLANVLLVVFISSTTKATAIDSFAQNELNKRLHIQGAMGGNITLTSNSSIGGGFFAFVVPGETNDGTPVAIKATSIEELESYIREHKCYETMNAMTDKVCEKYGIPFIYHSGDFFNYKTMAMTKLDDTLESINSKIGSISKESILIIFRDMIKTLKFMHSKGIIHQDINSKNIMTRGANVFLMDFNICVDKKLQNHPRLNSMLISTLALVMKQNSSEHHDMMILFQAMSSLANMKAHCYSDTILALNGDLNERKRQMKEDILSKNVNYIELVEPFVEFCFEAFEVMQEKRTPKYDHLYKMFDDLLYAGRNRSERIVFEWLTPAERAAAMDEVILPIESIVFPQEN